MLTTKKINKRYKKRNKEGLEMVHQEKNPSNTKEGNIGGIEGKKDMAQKMNSTMAEKNPPLSVITLKANGLISPIKRQIFIK